MAKKDKFQFDKKYGLYLVLIVAAVAVIGLFVMFSGGNASSGDNDLTGQVYLKGARETPSKLSSVYPECENQGICKTYYDSYKKEYQNYLNSKKSKSTAKKAEIYLLNANTYKNIFTGCKYHCEDMKKKGLFCDKKAESKPKCNDPDGLNYYKQQRSSGILLVSKSDQSMNTEFATKIDSCDEKSGVVTEWLCDNDVDALYPSPWLCPYGCEKGTGVCNKEPTPEPIPSAEDCIEKSTIPPLEENWYFYDQIVNKKNSVKSTGNCIDNDYTGDGYTIYEKGTVTWNGKDWSDYCKDGQLLEQWCNKNNPNIKYQYEMSCPSGTKCSDGACVPVEENKNWCGDVPDTEPTPTCTETDSGSDKDNKGVTTYNGVNYIDYCSTTNSDILKEYSCSYLDPTEPATIKCNSDGRTCKDGKCVKKAETNVYQPPADATCTDTDAAPDTTIIFSNEKIGYYNNLLVGGTVTFFEQTGIKSVYPDECHTTSGWIIEWVCDSPHHGQGISKKCPSGTLCIDTDGSGPTPAYCG
ncbi:MAG: hypothetical protein ABIG89_06700 [Candidatus Woesearchaeota archaeon]